MSARSLGGSEVLPAKTVPKFGAILGRVELSEQTLVRAKKFAADFFVAAEAEELSGEDVEVFTVPGWAPSRESWWPKQAMEQLGYRALPKGCGEDMVVTLGVDQHIDDAHGPVLCMVLHNDGLTFRQGAIAHKPRPGDWFIFNDRARHGVKEADGSAVFIALTVPVESVI